MKLWKKVYIIAMIIITLGANLGFFGIVYFTYEHMLHAEKERCQAEFGMIYESICADIAQLEEKYPMDIEYFQTILNVYNSYFEEDTELIGIWENEVLGQESQLDEAAIPNGISVQKEENTVIYMTQELSQTPVEYKIMLKRTLYDFDTIWETLLPLYISSGVLISIVISLILAMAVRILLKPLDELERAAVQVENENWSARVQIKGNHELAQLGRQFNSMAEAVEEHVEKLKEQTEQKEQLIHSLAHEMNTPITSIQGFADYMQMSALSEEEQRESLAFITAESKRLKEISATILSMAVMERGEKFPKQTFSIQQMCKRLEKLYEQQFQGTNTDLCIDCRIRQQFGNEALLESLLRNLINNASRAVAENDAGKICVTISAKENSVQWIVSDNGCGIAEKDVAQIFEPFYRVDKARSRSNGGSGLGLAFCKKIVEAHGGEIHVESEAGKGTQFIINFTV